MYNKSHKFTQSILKMYDIRGVYQTDFTTLDAYFIGKSYGTLLRNRNLKSCVVGMDGRESSPDLQAKFIEGLLTTGIDAINIGMVMSPCMYWAMWHLNCDAGMIITASHNPGEYNGFKMLTKDLPVWGEDIQELGKISENGKFAEGKGEVSKTNIKDKYIKFILSQLKQGKKNLKIAFDTGNGVVADIIKDVIGKVPNIEPVYLFDTVEGNFPNHLADPSLPDEYKVLKQTVLDKKCDLGIAYDGDGDRVGLMDSEGVMFFGDETLDVIMRPYLKENPGAKVIFELTSSQRLVNDIKKFGGVPLMWKPGHSTIKTKMKSDNVGIGGETSGHMYYGENKNFDDSLFATMKVINYLSSIEETLVDIKKTFPITYLTKKYKIKTPDDIVKFEAPKRIAERMLKKNREVIQIDGARVYVNENDWWLIRSSNTEPAMTARCEAMTEEGLTVCKKELEDELKKEGFEIKW
ncbi:MAG: phosphomannomutase/phosphoglucomutase [Rickettsiales bacterium]|jgi:phosphomannomutase|nr:phosphomannomutase/phosphoglucomutase [Rickettsiales bacterium]